MAQNQKSQAGTGFYTVTQTEGRWHFVDPKGKPFISKGVDSVRANADTIQNTDKCPYLETVMRKYGSVEAWRKAAAERLFRWNFNTLGGWSDPEVSKIEVEGRRLAYSHVLYFASAFAGHQRKKEGTKVDDKLCDVFDPEFAVFARQHASKQCAPYRDDPNFLGWYTDNELRWCADWRGPEELLVLFLRLPAQATGRRVAFDLLRARHPEIVDFNAVWGTSFSTWDEAGGAVIAMPPGMEREKIVQNAQVERTAATAAQQAFFDDCDAFLALHAERYCQITYDAVKAADPNHLVMGCRFAFVPPKPVLAAAAKYFEVISVNCYSYDKQGPVPALKEYAAYPKPVLIGEFSYRSKDSGLPNTHGAGLWVEDQQDRAEHFASYVTLGLRCPNLIGYHWFEHVDEPKEGRFDGENSNYGLVTINDDPYEVFVRKVGEINGQAEALRAE